MGSGRLGSLPKVTLQIIDGDWTPLSSRVLWASSRAWEYSSISLATLRFMGAAPMQTWWVDTEGLPDSILLVL